MTEIRPWNIPPHLCDGMVAALEAKNSPMEYSPQFREYSIRLRTPTSRRFGLYQSLFFCPWCGMRLPVSLRSQLYDELERSNGAEVEDFFEALSAAPRQYQDGEWWQDRFDDGGVRT